MPECGACSHHRSQSVGLSFLNDEDKKELSFVGKTNTNIILTFLLDSNRVLSYFTSYHGPWSVLSCTC